MTSTIAPMTTIIIIWNGSICGEPTADLFEQAHEFTHGNVKSARRTALARVRRWHGNVTLLGVLVNPTEAERADASDRAYAAHVASRAA